MTFSFWQFSPISCSHFKTEWISLNAELNFLSNGVSHVCSFRKSFKIQRLLRIDFTLYLLPSISAASETFMKNTLVSNEKKTREHDATIRYPMKYTISKLHNDLQQYLTRPFSTHAVTSIGRRAGSDWQRGSVRLRAE